MKKIANIVFYKFYENGKEERRACIFYTDGTVDDVSYENGIDACLEIVKERHITSKEEFKNMINNEIVHVKSRNDLLENFDSYKENSDIFEPEEDFEPENNFDINKANDGLQNYDWIPRDKYKDANEENLEESFLNNLNENLEEATEEEEYPDDYFKDYEEDFEKEEYPDDYSEKDIEDIEKPKDTSDNIEKDIEDYEEEPKKEGFIKRMWNKIKKNKIVSSIVFCVVAVATAFGIHVATKNLKNTPKENLKGNKESQIKNNKNKNGSKANSILNNKTTLIAGDNSLYDEYSYSDLLQVTESKTQKKAMKYLGKTIKNFNGKFADAHLESDKVIRASLTFDEVVALQQAYNNYNKNQIKAYFNGTEMDASEMEKDYKSASLQLMGAHVIETRENPVDMSSLLNSKEEKEFYEHYHELFLQAKEATGTDKIAKVNAFRQEIRKDFPITQEVRTEGIMHAEDYDKIESYKLSITPMIAAAEMMFQNLETDNTLNDLEIDFLNDIGLCNYAQDKFAKIQTITLSAEEDNTNPLYDQYRDALIQELKNKGQYITKDKKRDLSRLDSFQNTVNWHFEQNSNNLSSASSSATTESHNETRTWTTTDTTYTTEQTIEEQEIPAAEKDKIDQEIEKENKKAEKEGKKKAKQKQKKMQEEADEEASKVKEEVEKDEEDMQDKINDANNQINQNNADDDTSNDKPVNEDDFGDHEVDFDNNHSDENGNLDNSVENITTDSTGDQTDEELPDPNKTGAEFDQNSESSVNKEEKSIDPETKSSAGQTIMEYEETVPEMSNEDIVNAYVEGLANQTNEENNAYTYTYTNN